MSWWKMSWRTDEVMDVKSTILALRMMDLLPHHVDELIWLGNRWTHVRNISTDFLSDLGTTIRQACAGLTVIPKRMMEAIQRLTVWRCLIPRWTVAALMELAAQRPAMVQPYVLDIVKAIVLFFNNNPWC